MITNLHYSYRESGANNIERKCQYDQSSKGKKLLGQTQENWKLMHALSPPDISGSVIVPQYWSHEPHNPPLSLWSPDWGTWNYFSVQKQLTCI